MKILSILIFVLQRLFGQHERYLLTLIWIEATLVTFARSLIQVDFPTWRVQGDIDWGAGRSPLSRPGFMRRPGFPAGLEGMSHD